MADYSHLEVDEDGDVFNTSTGEYLTDDDGEYLDVDEVNDLIANIEAEQEAASDAEVDAEVDAFAAQVEGSYHALEAKLGREPTGKELDKLLAHAEKTGDPNIADAYETAIGRSADNGGLDTDEGRINVLAEYIEDGRAEDAEGDAGE